jgi:F420-0:gamma-glutamyl ligase
MNVEAIKTRHFKPPQDSLDDLLSYFDGKLIEGSVVAISSKVLGICAGSCVPIADTDKQQLQKEEASVILTRKTNNEILLTKKSDMLLEYAGVDTLDTGYYVMIPKKPYKIAMQIWKQLRKQSKIKKLGVIITDSHSVPFRKGAVGMAIAGYGFKPYVGYKTKNKVLAVADVLDGLAATANMVLGEAEKITPIAVINEIPDIVFFTKPLPPSVMRSYMYVRKNEVYSMF